MYAYFTITHSQSKAFQSSDAHDETDSLIDANYYEDDELDTFAGCPVSVNMITSRLSIESSKFLV